MNIALTSRRMRTKTMSVDRKMLKFDFLFSLLILIGVQEDFDLLFVPGRRGVSIRLELPE